eukprot:5490898-Pleurochrysis_carterae.AAC.1
MTCDCCVAKSDFEVPAKFASLCNHSFMRRSAGKQPRARLAAIHMLSAPATSQHERSTYSGKG